MKTRKTVYRHKFFCHAVLKSDAIKFILYNEFCVCVPQVFKKAFLPMMYIIYHCSIFFFFASFDIAYFHARLCSANEIVM